jgi:hypothetical protein
MSNSAMQVSGMGSGHRSSTRPRHQARFQRSYFEIRFVAHLTGVGIPTGIPGLRYDRLKKLALPRC